MAKPTQKKNPRPRESETKKNKNPKNNPNKPSAPAATPANPAVIPGASNAPKKVGKIISPNAGASIVPTDAIIEVAYKATGKSGTYVTSGEIADDHLNELIGIDGQIIYSKMLRSDSQIQKVKVAITTPIKSAKWSIMPASDDPFDLEVAKLIEQIIFKDLPRGFKGKLDEILTYIFKGFSCFEIIHANKNHPVLGPYTGLSNLAFRDQTTLEKFNFDKATEKLISVKQKVSGDLEADVEIPGNVLLFFYNEKKGSDLGFALCRSMYGAYKRKLLAEQLQIIGAEKAAIPAPILTLGKGVRMDSEDALAAKAQLEAWVMAETAYFMLPEGWQLTLNAQNTFDPAKLQVIIKACDEKISGTVVAMFLEMGIGGNSGNQAGVEGSIDFFNKGLASFADNIADIFNTVLIPHLVELNYGPIDNLPKLAHSGITEDAGKELMEVVTGYTKARVITPDQQLEDHVRKVHNLPKKAAGENVDMGTATPAPAATTTPKEEIQFADKLFKKPFNLITDQGAEISKVIAENIKFISSKYINDVMKKYKALPDSQKQKASSMIVPGGQKIYKEKLKRALTDTAVKALEGARQEVPSKKNIKLNHHEKFMLRLTEKYGDLSEYKLNEFSKLPAHVQVLIGKQVDLITKSTIDEVVNKVAFQFSSKEVKVSDPYIIQQALEEAAQDYVEKGTIPVKGVNAAATIVNESRDTFFFEPEVLDEIHSFTFTNPDPVTAVCKELNGVTFATNDAESLLFTPPLHHNCKSYLRANLKESKGVDKLQISTLSPSAKAKEGITL